MTNLRRKLPLFLVLIPLLLIGSASASVQAEPDASARPSYVDALLELMLKFKMPKGSVEEGLTDAEKLTRWRPLVVKTYAQCKRYERRTKVKAETCTAVSINAVYWETGLQQKYQLEPKVGPSGEECFFQIHRTAEQIPFDEWKPLHEYGTRHGLDYSRCVEDGVRILSYHPWRCHFDESKLRGTDNRYQLYRLYIQYYKPNPECRVPLYSIPAKVHTLLRRRANMAHRILKRLPADAFR
jgi:hypothetical protein